MNTREMAVLKGTFYLDKIEEPVQGDNGIVRLCVDISFYLVFSTKSIFSLHHTCKHTLSLTLITAWKMTIPL